MSFSAVAFRDNRAVAIALTALAYFIAGRAGLLLAIPPGYATAVWPAAGIAVIALTFFGYRLWPGILLGSFLVNVSTGFDTGSAAAMARSTAVASSIGVGAAVQACVATWFARRVLERDGSLLRAGAVCALLGLAGPLACVISASWGVTSLWLADAVVTGDVLFNWATWWVGDSIGVLLVTPIAFTYLAPPLQLWSRRRLVIVGPLLLSLLLVVGLYLVVSATERERLALEFAREASVLENALSRRLVRYVEAVESVQRFMSTSPDAGPAEFRTFVAPALARLVGLHALSWNPVVAGDALQSFEADARAKGNPQFRVRERTAAGELEPVTPRPVHVVVRYIEPLAGNELALGFDVYSNPVRRSALDRARDEGRAVATARITLVQETGSQSGVLVFVPAYGTRSVPAIAAERRAALRGYGVGVLRLGDVLGAALEGLGAADVEVRLFDDSGPHDPASLVVEQIDAAGAVRQMPSDTGAATTGLDWTGSLDFAGRAWRLVVTPSPDYLTKHRSMAAWGVLAAGLAFSSLLGGFLMILTGRGLRDEERVRELAGLNHELSEEITEHQRTERALSIEKERAEVTLHSIGDGVITTDRHGVVEYVNPVAEKLTGWTDVQARGKALASVFRIINEETREPSMDPVERCRAEGRVIGLANNTVLIARSGREHAIMDSAAPIRDRSGEMLGVILVFHDVTETRRMAREAAHYASHDSLTGLVNRREFDRRLESALSSTHEYGSRHALCYLDLDQFKIVNDTAGHRAGDELLKLIASLLAREVRDRDTLARLGGDEFGLLLNNCPMDKAREITETLVAAVRAFDFAWDGRVFQVGVSVGLVPVIGTARNAEELLAQADVACYAAKDAGRNRVHVYGGGDSGPDPSHREILRVGELRHALDANRFALYAQPVFALDGKAPRLERHELLLRLLDVDDQPVAARDFIPAAERYGLMDQVDRWVVRTALRDLALVFAGEPDAKVSINISGNSLNDDGLLAFLREQLEEYAVDSARVCFEITETGAIRNLSVATRFMESVRGLGCEFALDDFGSGLSSFAYLKAMPVNYLKIDGSLVRNVATDSKDQAMVETINELAHRMGIRTVAEYVENQACLDYLRGAGVDFAQGFHLGRPEALPRVGDAASLPAPRFGRHRPFSP